MSHKQVFCFTYAGGNGEFFNIIEKDLAGLELIKPDYAGHGKRYKDDFYNSFDELANDIFQRIQNRLYGDYALLGYSMGSISLVEVLRRIIESGLPQPTNVFLAAHAPITESQILHLTTNELDKWVKDRTIRFGEVPDRLLSNKAFWRTYLPIYKADYSIIGEYEFETLELKTDIPADVFYSETDTPLVNMKQWERHFPCEFHHLPGTHFFIRQHHEEMAAIIRKKMEAKHDF